MGSDFGALPDGILHIDGQPSTDPPPPLIGGADYDGSSGCLIELVEPRVNFERISELVRQANHAVGVAERRFNQLLPDQIRRASAVWVKHRKPAIALLRLGLVAGAALAAMGLVPASPLLAATSLANREKVANACESLFELSPESLRIRLRTTTSRLREARRTAALGEEAFARESLAAMEKYDENELLAVMRQSMQMPDQKAVIAAAWISDLTRGRYVGSMAASWIKCAEWYHDRPRVRAGVRLLVTCFKSKVIEDGVHVISTGIGRGVRGMSAVPDRAGFLDHLSEVPSRFTSFTASLPPRAQSEGRGRLCPRWWALMTADLNQVARVLADDKVQRDFQEMISD